MSTAIGLMYVEGEVRDGYITGRTIIGHRDQFRNQSNLAWITLPAKLPTSPSWPVISGKGSLSPVDIVRLEKPAEGVASMNGGRRITSFNSKKEHTV